MYIPGGKHRKNCEYPIFYQESLPDCSLYKLILPCWGVVDLLWTTGGHGVSSDCTISAFFCVIAKVECNWYLLDINICFLSEKKICIFWGLSRRPPLDHVFHLLWVSVVKYSSYKHRQIDGTGNCRKKQPYPVSKHATWQSLWFRCSKNITELTMKTIDAQAEKNWKHGSIPSHEFELCIASSSLNCRPEFQN
jgi:hypothetical protein